MGSGLISKLFPAGVSHSFSAGTAHGLLSLQVFYKFPTLQFCHDNQTKWSPLIDTSQAMTPSLPQAICFSYAPLQKKKKKKKKKKKLQWNLVNKISQKSIWAILLKQNVLRGDKKMTQLSSEFFFFFFFFMALWKFQHFNLVIKISQILFKPLPWNLTGWYGTMSKCPD